MLIQQIRHPDYLYSISNWEKWRLTYDGGSSFIGRFLKKFSVRESNTDFNDRLAITHCPAFAKAAINEVKKAIFQRLTDITREGTQDYINLANGLKGGVDGTGMTMTAFMGNIVLPELITMKSVGIYIDMPEIPDNVTLNEVIDIYPYVYIYNVEDILSWVKNNKGEITSVLLRQHDYILDKDSGLPTGKKYIYKHLYYNTDGFVVVTDYEDEKDKIGTTTILKIKKMPFIIAEISESLLTDIADYQITLLNMSSSDTSYILKGNLVFYTEQFDPRADNPFTKTATIDQDTGEISDTNEKEVTAGTLHGRRYPINTERPGFIAPPTEPILASMKKQDQLKEEIRLLLNLTISNLQPKIASAESKSKDENSLEAGLSYIGLALEEAERKIAEVWCAYLNKQAPMIKYPTNYSLKTDEDIMIEADKSCKFLEQVPSLTFKKFMAKRVINILARGKVSQEDLFNMLKEIDACETVTSNIESIQKDVELGIVSSDYACKLRGYPEGEAEKAKIEHAEKLARIALAQGQNLSSRGIDNDKQEAKDEKTISQTQELNENKAVRGEGK